MSEFLAAASSKTGVPEELLQRAAAARAEASGSTADAVLEAWAAGGAIAAAEPPSASSEPPAEPIEAAGPQPEGPASSDQPPATPGPEIEVEPVVTTAVPPVAAAAFSRESVAPVLTGRSDNPWVLILGAIGVLLLGALFGVLLPSLDVAEARSDAIPGTTIEYSDTALEGRTVYLREGCWYCHTQQVRPIVTDAGLGRVTTAALVATEPSDTLGFLRLGPDVANAAAREPFNDPGTIVAYLRNPASVVEGSRQPSYAHLGTDDLEAVAQYLIETSEPYAPDTDE